MKRNISILTVILLVVPLLSGFARKAEKYTDPTLPIEQRVDDLLKRMTLDEKIAQMDMVGVWSFDEFKESEMIRTTGVGAFIGEVTPERYNEVQALSEKSRLKIPMLVGVDAVHGYGVLQNRTIFPTSISMAATFNPELVNRAARIAAREIRSAGNQWTFAPTLDIVQDARFGRTGETYGECPFLTTAMARSAIRGYQNHENPQHRVAACVKHYVGGGASIGGVNHGNAEISERMLRSVFLPPFKAAVEEGVLTVMPGHNNINGIPMHASEWLLTDILKEEFGFDGFVITDMGDIENLREDRIHGVASDQKDAVRQAIAAGVDMHMFTTDNTENGQRMFQGNLRELVHEGKISTATIDRAVRRILTVKFELGLFENRYVEIPTAENPGYGGDEANGLALEAARQSVVLLKNEGGLLPLDRTKYRRILVTGPNAANQSMLGDWTTLQEDENHYYTLLRGICECVGDECEIVYSNSGRIKGKKSDVTVETTDPVTQSRQLEEGGELNEFAIEDAVEKAKRCDLAIIAVGGYGIRTDWGLRTYGESADRPTIDFYGRQEELIRRVAETGIPVVAVIVTGTALNNPWTTENIPAILNAWEPGMYGGRAVAEILFGVVNPSGKLPITIPRTAGQIPMYYYQTKSRYTTGYALGSGRSDDKPAFCFGHGLSYTSFDYGNMRLSSDKLQKGVPLKVSADITNKGDRAGYETVMLFVNDRISSVVTPLHCMKGFEKVWLEPGQTKTVTMTVPFDEFGLWNADMEYVVEPGEFELKIGSSVDDIRLKKTIVY